MASFNWKKASPEWKKLANFLVEFGCELEMGPGGGGHVKVFYDNRLITSMPGSPGDNRAMSNTLGDLRRRIPGFEYRTKQVRKKRDQNEEDE